MLSLHPNLRSTIALFLDPPSLYSLLSTCKFWAALSNTNYFWHQKYLLDYPTYPSAPTKILYKKLYLAKHVYAWGYNLYGQLGMKTATLKIATPIKLPIKAKQVFVKGTSISFIVTPNYDLYACGNLSNFFGTLDLPETTSEPYKLLTRVKKIYDTYYHGITCKLVDGYAYKYTYNNLEKIDADVKCIRHKYVLYNDSSLYNLYTNRLIAEKIKNFDAARDILVYVTLEGNLYKHNLVNNKKEHIDKDVVQVCYYLTFRHKSGGRLMYLKKDKTVHIYYEASVIKKKIEIAQDVDKIVSNSNGFIGLFKGQNLYKKSGHYPKLLLCNVTDACLGENYPLVASHNMAL